MDAQILIGFVVLVTSIWIGIDASHIGAGKYRVGGIADNPPLAWAIYCLLLWIVFAPTYLYVRPKIIAAKAAAESSGQPAQKMSFWNDPDDNEPVGKATAGTWLWAVVLVVLIVLLVVSCTR